MSGSYMSITQEAAGVTRSVECLDGALLLAPAMVLEPISPRVLAMSAEEDSPQTGAVVEEARAKLKQPPRYQVVLLNDDYTPMDFVVYVLQQFFTMDLESATRVMLAVHTQGKGICGVFTRDIAETKAAQVNRFARENEHPLLCEIEQADGDEE